MTWVCANESCAQPLRRASVPLAQAPGTQQMAADGLCKRCYNQRRRDAEYLTPQQLHQARQALNDWLRARNKRLRSNEAPWQLMRTESTTVKLAPERRRSGNAKPTDMRGVVARRGATIPATPNPPTPTAQRTEHERSAL